MSEGRVVLALEHGVATITFDRPQAHNAMTKTMYTQLHQICLDLAAREDVRVGVLRGAGGKAFIAGSDIGLFEKFTSGQDGVDYEAEMETYTSSLADLPFPTVAVIEGWAVGGGLNLAAVCDLRIATPNARLGVPISKTVGNCLSILNYARLVAGFGASRAKRMLMLGDFVGAEEARQCGFLARVVQVEDLDQQVEEICARIVAHAPITMRVSKEAIARVIEAGVDHEAEDLVAQAYGSQDFKTGVAAFKSKSAPQWVNR